MEKYISNGYLNDSKIGNMQDIAVSLRTFTEDFIEEASTARNNFFDDRIIQIL